MTHLRLLQLADAPRVLDADGTALPLAARDAALLAWLALEGPTPRARLAALLWPDSEHDTARNALRQRLFQLRKAHGVDLAVGSRILSLAADVAHDLHDADGVLGQAEAAASGEFETWLAHQRLRRRNRLQESMHALAQMAEEACDWADALSHAQELLALEPVSEAAHRRVIRLHYLAGDRTAALLAFDRCEQLLKHEVGATPGAETLALLATVERAAPDALLRPATGMPPAVLRPPCLVGRDAERRALGRVLDEELVVLVIGEAGMGKSRLIADCFGAAGLAGAAGAAGAASAIPAVTGQAAAAVLVIGARPGDAAVPYAMAARLLRALLQRTEPSAAQRSALASVLPELAEAPPGAARDHRVRLRGAAQALLEQAVHHGLRAVVIDDLHYADTPSLELLHPLVGGVGCGWVVAMRPDELGVAARALVQAHAGSTGALTLQLQALDTATVAMLLDSLGIDGLGGPVQAESLRRRTGGNPMYLLETLKLALAAPRPSPPLPTAGAAGAAAAMPQPGPGLAWPQADNVQRLIQQRLLRLSPLALKLARCAALAGQDLSAPLVAQVLGLPVLDLADAWSELELAQVLCDGAFVHDLIAEAARAQVPLAIARTLHAQIAGFLEANAGQAAHIAAHIATHWLAAHEPLKAVPHLNRAARQAQAAWQRGVAASLHEQAATILRQAGDRRGAFDAYFAAAQAASQIVSQNVGKERMAGYGLALQQLADDDGQRAAAALVPAFLLLESREIDASRQRVLEALPLAQRAGLADIEVELLWDLTLLHLDRRELADARQRAEQALARLEHVDPATARLDQLGTRFKLMSVLGRILSATGDYARGDSTLQQALQQARHDREWAFTGFIASDLATNALEQGRLDQALRWSAESTADEARFDGGEHERGLVGSNRALVLSLCGDLGGALAAAEQTVTLYDRSTTRAELRSRQRLHALQFDLGRRDLALQGFQALRARPNLQAPERIALDAELLRAGATVDAEALLEQIIALDDFPLRARLLSLAQSGCPPLHVLPLLSLSAATARDQGAHGLWMTLQRHRLAALRLAGRAGEARALALLLWQRVDDGIAGIEMFPYLAAEICAALAEPQAGARAAECAEAAQQVALRASAWMQRAAETLPAPWRQTYLTRAPVLQGMPPVARALLTRC